MYRNEDGIRAERRRPPPGGRAGAARTVRPWGGRPAPSLSKLIRIGLSNRPPEGGPMRFSQQNCHTADWSVNSVIEQNLPVGTSYQKVRGSPGRICNRLRGPRTIVPEVTTRRECTAPACSGALVNSESNVP